MPPTTHRTPGEMFAGYTQLVTEVCCTCGVSFAMPEMLRAKALADHDRWFYCPNGHSQHFTGKTEEEKLRERLEREQARAGRLASERDQLEAARRAQAARATRFKNDRDRERRRAAHGVCPCCGRTFKQLARHMASQHPGFVADADHEAAAAGSGA